METITVTTDAVILPPQKGKDLDPTLIHCPDFTDGTMVSVTIGNRELRAQTRDFSDRLPEGIPCDLAIPHQMFPDFDASLTEDLIREGVTHHTIVRRLALPDHKDQLTVDHFLDGKTETDVNHANTTS
jgi:hypothetical protein